MILRKSLLLLLIIPFVGIVSAHCPLCTIGAGAAAGAAVWLGVSKVVVALFIGAFAMSMGMWFAKLPKKRYIPFQRTAIIVGVFLLTVLPLLPIVKAVGPLYLSFIGDYGTTFALNYSLFSSLLGGAVTFISPGLNKKIKEKTKRSIKFQGILTTFALLIIIGGIIQILI